MNPQPNQPDTHTQLRGPWLLIARAAWIALVALMLALFIAGIPTYYDQQRTVCTELECERWQLTPEDARTLQELDLSLEFNARYRTGVQVFWALAYSAIGALIFWRKSDDWMALLTSFALVFLGANFLSHNPDALAATQPAWNMPNEFVISLGTVSLFLFIYLFPDGRFAPRWTRWPALVSVVWLPTERFFLSAPYIPELLWNSLFLGLLGIGILAQFYRYVRVSGPMQRQQTKWVLYSFAGFGLAIILVIVNAVISRPDQASGLYLYFDLLRSELVDQLVVLFLPLSIAISILHYRLWDIDVLINRTMVYGVLTGALGLVYFGSVVLFQGLFRALTGQESQLAVVASTLAIAGLFAPLRWRIQDTIDRRFYRRKYDAEKVLAEFAEFARDEVDLDRLTDELLWVIDETMQPEFVSLWLRAVPSGSGERREEEIGYLHWGLGREPLISNKEREL